MCDSDSRPFAGLFDLASPDEGRELNWNFFEPDLNDSVRRLLTHLDSLFALLAEPGWVLLTTIENDAEAGRFPEVLRNFFDGESVSTCARYFVAPIGHVKTAPESVVGRLTFETRPGQLTPVLALNDGFSWGSDLSVGGIQVRELDVAQAVTLNPFSVADATKLETISRLAWATSRDLNTLGLNISPGHEQLLESAKRVRAT